MIEKPTSGWLLYDDSCGICRRWIGVFKNLVERRGYRVAPLQSEWVSKQLQLSPEQLLHDFRLLLPDGRQVVGADAYRHVMRRVWWAYPLYLLSIVPVFRRAFDGGYRLFARHRHRISRTCRIPPVQ